MSIYSWEVFITVAEMQSFVRAAEALHVSQSAVSHVIRKLEEENNIVLFVRNRNKAELTISGQMIMPLVRNLIECSRMNFSGLDEKTIEVNVRRLGEFFEDKLAEARRSHAA